jgi:nucleotide-binding universal stress UspA family protein
MREFGNRRAVVGYDGTPAARRAVDWAADEATRRHLSLQVVHVVDRGLVEATPSIGTSSELSGAIALADAVTTEGVELVRQRHPRLRVVGTTLVGSPRTVLVEVARDADLLVVGGRDHGGAAATVLGSVATSTVAHAPCPVVVVRGDHVVTPGPRNPVVVGIDDSEPAAAALRHAADLAATAQAPLRIVCARRPLPLDGWIRAYWQAVDPSHDATGISDEAGRAVLGRARDAVQARQPEVAVQTVLAEGSPVGVILSHARDAALVVVGARARARGSLAGLVLGSVSQGVVHAAHCPVLVVRTGADTSTDAALTATN